MTPPETPLTAELAQYVPDLLGRISLPMELFQRIRAAVATQGEPQEPTYRCPVHGVWQEPGQSPKTCPLCDAVCHAEAAAQPARQGEQRKPLWKILAEARVSETYRVESEALERQDRRTRQPLWG